MPLGVALTSDRSKVKSIENTNEHSAVPHWAALCRYQKTLVAMAMFSAYEFSAFIMYGGQKGKDG